MNDDTVNRALDMVAVGAGKLEQAVRDMAPHIWDAEVAYWRVQGWFALAALPLAAATVAALYRIGKKNPVPSYDINGFYVAAAITGLVGGVAAAVAIGTAGAAAFAPEMYAVRDLLEIIK